MCVCVCARMCGEATGGSVNKAESFRKAEPLCFHSAALHIVCSTVT